MASTEAADAVPAETATTTTTNAASSSPKAEPDAKSPPSQKKEKEGHGKLQGTCIHCGVAMGNFLGTMAPEGPIHNECIPPYKRLHVERCAHCDCVLREARTIIGGRKLHPECVADYKAKKPFEPPRKEGIMRKFAIGRSFFSGKNWKERYFVLSKATGLAYYESKAAFSAGKPPKNAVMLTPQVRLITGPNRLIHKEALNPSTELIVVFFEGGVERRLLLQTANWQEHEDWVRVLETYIKNVNDPRDVRD